MALKCLNSLLEEDLPRMRSAANLKLSVLLLPAYGQDYA